MLDFHLARCSRVRTVAQRAELYRDLAFGHLVVTVKEAFPVAPGIGVVITVDEGQASGLTQRTAGKRPKSLSLEWTVPPNSSA